MAGMLYGVAPNDPVTFIAVPLLLAAAALGASWLPARRAARVDPARTLQAE
jgi:ABC-type lipoprotein release transport system permease subunit